MKRYCTQLGISLHATDDNMNSAAATHVVSEQALQALIEVKDGNLHRSFFSTESMHRPMIVVCATRESASKLRSGPLGRSLPGATQYLWLPIGPTKLSGALSMRRMYCPYVSWPINVELTTSQRKCLLSFNPMKLLWELAQRRFPKMSRQRSNRGGMNMNKKELLPASLQDPQAWHSESKTKIRSLPTLKARREKRLSCLKGTDRTEAAAKHKTNPSTTHFLYARRCTGQTRHRHPQASIPSPFSW